MAKPMLVTFPFVLLLLDVWPLKRCSFPLRWKTIGKLLQEKVPLLVLVIIDCILTFNAQHFSGAVSPLEGLTLTARLANTFVSYIAYIEKAFLPINLALLYPLQSYTAAVIAGSFILFTAITAACCFWRKKHPYLIVGWLWYAGMLVPVIGLVQVGVQSMADRYTYLPMIGLSISIIWLVSDWVEKKTGWKNILVIISAFLFIFWGVQTYKQLEYWKSSQSLYEHTLAVTSDNYLIHTSLGSVFSGQGRLHEAIDHFNAALAINPKYAIAHYNLGVALFKQGNINEAITHYQEAIAIDPNYAEAHHNWGLALAKQGNTNDAINHFRLALAINPNYVEAHNYLGAVLAEQGNNNEAIAQFKEALAINPAFADAHNNWGLALAKQGDLNDAIAHFRMALDINPNFADAHNNLGTALAQQGNIDEAITHFRLALAIKPNFIGAQNNLARALASYIKK
jgi:tetratricopeptide (TPR) repeat protein